MSFQGFQGSVGSVGSAPTSTSAQEHLKRVQAKLAQNKIDEANRKAGLAKINLTGNGQILDTQKGGGTSGKFTIVGGKAVRTSTLGSNIARSTPSILTRSGQRLTADSPNLTNAQKAALGIISGQQQATFNLADKISNDRRIAKEGGLSVKDAQDFATNPEVNSFSTRDRNIVNTALQTDVIRSNAAKLNFAEELIANQTSNEFGANTLDDLQAQLDNAPNQDSPINRINLSTNPDGSVVSPRNVKLQIENAGLTGGLTAPILNILTSGGSQATRDGTNTPNVEEIAQVIRTSLSDITDNAEVGNLTSVSQLPDGTLAIDFSENSPEIFRAQFGDAVFEAIGKFFDLKDQGVDDFFSNPEGLRIKIGEEEVSLGGSGGGSGGFASELLDGQGFDFLGLVSNPIFIIAVVAIAGLGVFLKVRK